MRDIIVHRGPDAGDNFIDGPLGFGVRLPALEPWAYEFRVRAVDLNGYAQPEPRPNPQSGIAEVPCLTFTVKPRERDLLYRGLGELLYQPGRDPRLAQSVRELMAKLKQLDTEGQTAEHAVRS